MRGFWQQGTPGAAAAPPRSSPSSASSPPTRDPVADYATVATATASALAPSQAAASGGTTVTITSSSRRRGQRSQAMSSTAPAAGNDDATLQNPSSQTTPKPSPSRSTLSPNSTPSPTMPARYPPASALTAHAPASAAGGSPHTPAATSAAGGAPAHTPAYDSFLSMRRRTVFLINCVGVMERMDEQIVPALSRPLGCAFRAGPHALGLITFARALVQAVASPLGGIAGHYCDRVAVLFAGCAIWGFFATAFSFANTVHQGIMAWAFNGIGLALIIPNSQSLVADYYTATRRGEAFGTLMLTGAVGGMLGSVYATNLGGYTPFGVEGWRVAFVSVGAVSLAIGAATLLLAVDPRRSTAVAAAGGRQGGYVHLPTDEDTLALEGWEGQCGEEQGEDKEHGARRRRHHRGSRRSSLQPQNASAAGAAAHTAIVPVHRTGVGALSVPEVVEEGEEEVGQQQGTGEGKGGGSGGSGTGRGARGDEDGDGDEGDVEWGGGASSCAAEKEPLVGAKGRRGQGAGAGGGASGAPRVADLGCPAPHLLPSPRRPLLSLQHGHRHPHSPVRHKAAAGGRDGSQAPAHRSGWLFPAAAAPRAKATDDSHVGGPADGKAAAGGWADTAPQWEAEHAEGGFHVVGCAVEGGSADAAVAAAALGSSGRRPLTWARMRAMLTTPTFLIIILQGIVGSTPWNALVFLTLYLQLLGFSDLAASCLLALLLGGTAAGALVGGWLGDRVAERWPNHGRIALVQFSVGIGVPLTALLLRGMPMEATNGATVAYATLLLITGVLTSWAAPACNNPVFAEIVPPDMRNLVYAFDRSFEGAISALGAPLVGMAAERWFGFEGVAAGDTGCHSHNTTEAPPADLVRARALGDAMLLFMAVPWTLCTLFYTGLHWCYPRDRARALQPQVAEVFGSKGRRGLRHGGKGASSSGGGSGNGGSGSGSGSEESLLPAPHCDV